MDSKPIIAFFGATGGCALAALTLSLQAGYPCSALVRTPSKLTALLTARSAPQANLTLIEGNVKDAAAVSKALLGATVIVSGVGGRPKLLPNPFRPTIDDPAICRSAAATIVSCLQELQRSAAAEYRPPLLAAISSTGLDARPADLPWALVPLYKGVLGIPHEDKKAMEDAIVAAPPDLLEYVIVRAALLTDGAPRGAERVRAGYAGRVKKGDGRWGDVEGVASGYTVSREDVGVFLFEEVVEREGGEWKGRKVSLVN